MSATVLLFAVQQSFPFSFKIVLSVNSFFCTACILNVSSCVFLGEIQMETLKTRSYGIIVIVTHL